MVSHNGKGTKKEQNISFFFNLNSLPSEMIELGRRSKEIVAALPAGGLQRIWLHNIPAYIYDVLSKTGSVWGLGLN